MLVSSLVLFAAAYAAGVGRLWRTAGPGRGVSFTRAALFAAGWVVLVAALVSPLDEWSEHSFFAHMLQHELLMIVAAPLVALSQPLLVMTWNLGTTWRRRLFDMARR